MDVLDLRLERLCDRVTLVQGVGDRRRGRLCVMSFVALLAGEDHSDHPACASPLIRGVALPVNDALPLRERQCLKAFAARIVGTADGCDAARAEVLRRVLADEILPSVRRDFCDRQAEGPRRASFEFLWAGSVGRDLEARIVRLLARYHGEGLWTCSWASLGSAAGELLALCMREATTRERRRWYWGAAIGLLDRLCDVGAEGRAPAAIQGNRLEQAEALLAHARGRVGFNAGAAVRRLCPAFSRADHS
jgi:hypothetical protein